MTLNYKNEKTAISAEHLEELGHQAKIGNLSDVSAFHMSDTLRNMPMAPGPDILGESISLVEAEKSQTAKDAFSHDWRSILYCLIYVLPAIGQGFDSGAGSISVNMPAFLIKFGAFNEVTKLLYVPSLWLALWNASSSFGNAIGSLCTGAFTDRFGYRYTQIGACIFSIATVFLQVFAVDRIMILFGKLLNGISMGMFVAISAGYISEVAGTKTRAFVMSVLAATPVIGIVAAVGIGSDDRVIGNLSDLGSWQLIFALQWVLPALAVPLVFIAPESPTQLVKMGRPERALNALQRMRPFEGERNAGVRLAGTQLSVASSIEEARSQSNSYLDCFKGVDMKRTLTVMAMFCGTQFSGVALLSNGLYFLAQTGLPFKTVSSIALAFLGLSCIICMFASFLLEYFGRRNTLVYGSLIHAALLILIGILHYATSNAGLLLTAILFNFAISTAQFASNAPVFALAVEISSVRLRSKTQSLGLATYYVFGWIFLFTVPYMFQPAPEGADWGVRASWLFAGLTLVLVVFAYFFVPETKGRSYADIDALYQRKISPRKFRETEVHAERDAIA